MKRILEQALYTIGAFTAITTVVFYLTLIPSVQNLLCYFLGAFVTVFALRVGTSIDRDDQGDNRTVD